jgi:hypothetical protein
MKPRPSRRSKQMPLVFRTWGGARKGAGRKPKGPRPLVSHAARPALDARHPVHVTLRVARSVPNLRSQRCMSVLRRAFAASKGRLGLRLVHFSVQGNHIHLIVEADGAPALSRGLQGLGIRIARNLNGALGRGGAVFADRYHARALTTPRETRNCIAYVLLNHRNHAKKHGWDATFTLIDTCSSAAGFDGFRAADESGGRWSQAGLSEGVVPARTWLLLKGWRRCGLIDPQEVPGRV